MTDEPAMTLAVLALLARAWDEGHRTPQLRGYDDCECEARSLGECACGRYGTGELVSLSKNPYRDPA